MGRPREPIRERFWKYVNKTPTCWLWTGSTVDGGYGQIHEDGKLFQAHRLSWLIHVGPIPEGLNVLHSCDTPPCVNPDHLFLGTHKENMEDRNKKKRHMHGATHYKAKLTREQVVRIRTELRHTKRSDVAALFGVSIVTIDKIRSGETWKD